MIEGQASWKAEQPDLNPIVFEVAQLESRVIELEGNYNKKYDARILAMKKRIMELNNKLKNESDGKDVAA